MLRGLFEAIENFMRRSSQPLQSWFRRRFLNERGAYNGDFFYNNFEMSVLFWRRIFWNGALYNNVSFQVASVALDV
jgi:hypothetical protein